MVNVEMYKKNLREEAEKDFFHQERNFVTPSAFMVYVEGKHCHCRGEGHYRYGDAVVQTCNHTNQLTCALRNIDRHGDTVIQTCECTRQ